MVSEKKESLEKDQEKIELKVTSGENKETLSDFLTCADSSLEVSQKENFSENKSLQNISLNGEKTFLKFEEQCKKAKQKNYFSNTVQILIIVSLLAVFIFQSITHQFWNLNSIGVFGVVLFLFYVCIFTGFTLQACKFFRLNLIYDFLVIFSYPAFAFWISSTARKNLARVFLRWKENDQAFECYRKTLSSGGEYSGFADAEVLIEMASIDFLRGRVNSAVELARRSCDRAYHMADSTGYGMGDMKKYGDFKKSKSKYLLGFLYYELKKYDLASDLIGEAIDLSEGAAIRNRNNSSVDYGAIDHRLN